MTKKPLMQLSLDNIDKTALVCKALSSESRLNILKYMGEQPAIISDLSSVLDIPLSTMTMHIRMLEKAGLIKVTPLPGSRGSQKLCAVVTNGITIEILKGLLKPNSTEVIFKQDVPIGNYFTYQISSPCGIASDEGYISSVDDTDGFSSPERFAAQIIWFTQGFLEYKFSVKAFKMAGYHVERVEFVVELCSEIVGYNENWRSDVSLWINDTEIGIIECPGDHGERRGRLNPGWWPENATQFGDLHHIAITEKGCTIDSNFVSSQTISSLMPENAANINFRIGVKPEARFPVGLNLVGEKFGDYDHGILMQVYGRQVLNLDK